ncbi:MAG TPA: glycoside hydrolase family 2 TIM barrel-domain containing protein, partial [Gaiellaceae bacterium]|nr:glycoside hydrolase family 2 TIM barrel-domain containing protein [Gaiellaceae bacterium]
LAGAGEVVEHAAGDARRQPPRRVPGSVLDDLARAGEVADLYRERNSLLAEWVPERAWILRRRVSGGRVRFDGVDHEATVYVDGEEVGRHAGAFTPFDVDVPPGEHLLAVVIHPAPDSEPQVGLTSRVRVHKPRMSYGWDFCPRLVHQGIWRPVTLDPAPEVFPSVRLEDGAGVVEVDGEVVLRVEDPELWWPNGMGAQRLHSVPELGIEVGFRTVELDRYALAVNGVRAPIRGWNWVPVDALYGVPRPEKVAHLLGLAARSGANLVRVWGGGLVETREFYECCDRLGLLVWQEFSQSSSGIESVPSDDPAFVELMAAEARAIVPRLRRHPSLAIWGGGNELDGDDSTPVLAALREVVHELDPGRAWLPTSPLGEDDVHGPWEHQGLRAHHEHYDSRTSLLHSEFGVEGMTSRRALRALIGEERRWPADRSNPVYEHLGAWWNNAPLVQECFGGRLGDVESLRRASQWLQYAGLRYAVEATLRRGAGTIPWQLNESYPNAWCTSSLDHRGDPKPAYWGVARAYRGAPSARFATSAWGGEDEFRAESPGPARVLDLRGRVVAESDGGPITAPLDAIDGDVFLLEARPADASDTVSLGCPGTTRYVMSKGADLAPLLDLPPAALRVERASDTVSLANVGDVAALGLVLEDARPYEEPGWVLFSDNVVDLLPGETREIRVEGPAGELRVEGWNARA